MDYVKVVFARYIHALLRNISDQRVCCNIGGIFYDILACAVDMVLQAPSWLSLQQLIDVLLQCCFDIDLACNIKKTVCMVFSPKCRNEIVCNTFRCFLHIS